MSKRDLFQEALAKVPPELKASGGDSVDWAAVNAKKAKFGNWAFSACYSPIMSHLPTLEISCRPYPRNARNLYGKSETATPEQILAGRLLGRLSPLQYARFTRNASRSGVFPPGVQASSNSEYGNCLVVPQEGWDRHTIFIILCVYRWLDSVPNKMWAVMTLMDTLRKKGIFLPFLQVLSYVMLHEFSYGHGFLYNGGTHRLNPALGWAWAKLNATPMPERPAAGKPGSSDTWSELLKMSTTLNPYIKKSDYQHGNPTLHVAHIDDLLHPRLSPLYTHPEQFGPEEFKQLMSEMPKAEKPPAVKPPAVKLQPLVNIPAAPVARAAVAAVDYDDYVEYEDDDS